MNDVVILGAGFSQAVSECYPLTDELGALALERAGIPASERPPKATRFEAWLSRLAEDQPYRSVEDNLRARARLVEMSRALTGVLREREAHALAGSAPAWLDDLVAVLHARQATVVSFNYDHVLECAVDRSHLTDRAPTTMRREVTSDDILDQLPPTPPPTRLEIQELVASQQLGAPRYRPAWTGQQVADTFRLLKLHGSLSWYWNPEDLTGVTVARWRVPGPGVEEDDGERSRALPGREPFVVPPTATKSAYLTNPVIRELWTRARMALAAADRVVLAGYSAPLEDHVAAGLLAETLAGRGVEVVIADPCATDVASRLAGLGVRKVTEAMTFGGVEDLVAWWVKDQARVAVEKLRSLAADPERGGWDDVTVNLRWGDGQASRIDAPASVQPSGKSDLVVAASPVRAPPADATCFLDLVAGKRGLRRVLVEADGDRFPVIDVLEPPGSESHPSRRARFLTLVAVSHPIG